MKIDWKNLNIKELAGLICQHLRKNNIESVLVGGACVSIYSRNKYISSDLDFISHSSVKDITPVLEKLGFIKKSGRHFEHSECSFFIEFLAPPAAIGDDPIERFKHIKTKYGILKLLYVEDCIKDRLAAFYFWNDPQSLEQALLLADIYSKEINFNSLKKWSKAQGYLEKFQVFFKSADKRTGR